MSTKKIGLALFFVGIFFLFVHTTLPFLWALVGVPIAYPLASNEGIWGALSFFTPALGGLVMVLGGIVYGREERDVI